MADNTIIFIDFTNTAENSDVEVHSYEISANLINTFGQLLTMFIVEYAQNNFNQMDYRSLLPSFKLFLLNKNLQRLFESNHEIQHRTFLYLVKNLKVQDCKRVMVDGQTLVLPEQVLHYLLSFPASELKRKSLLEESASLLVFSQPTLDLIDYIKTSE